MDWPVSLDLPIPIVQALSNSGTLVDIRHIPRAGVFQPGRAWKVTFSGPGSEVLVKQRASTNLAKKQAELAYSLLCSRYFRASNWVPKPILQFGPFQEFAGSLYQALEWVPGEKPLENQFPIALALERLAAVHRFSKSIFGALPGPVPGIEARLEILGRPLSNSVTHDTVAKKAISLVDQWTPHAIALLRKAPAEEPLIVCHGDCWIGNWLAAAVSSEESFSGEYSYPCLIDWANVRWDHPAIDRARLIGSVGDPVCPVSGSGSESLEMLLAWTGHLAALRRWLVRSVEVPWSPMERERVVWILTRLGVGLHEKEKARQ